MVCLCLTRKGFADVQLSTILRFKEAKGDKLPLPDLPFNSARPVPRPARPENPNLRTNGKFEPACIELVPRAPWSLGEGVCGRQRD